MVEAWCCRLPLQKMHVLYFEPVLDPATPTIAVFRRALQICQV